MATQQDLLDAQVAALNAETEAAKLAMIMAHANLTLAIINDKHGASGRSVAAASAEATAIMQASALAVTRPEFWGTK